MQRFIPAVEDLIEALADIATSLKPSMMKEADTWNPQPSTTGQQQEKTTCTPLSASIAAIGCEKDEPSWLRVALYARYSLDLQRPTSIDDQVRMCREVAQRLGMKIDDDLIFFDEAVSGQAHKTNKRSAYLRLRELVRSGKIDVLICDQQCRLARSARESLDFLAELHEHKVRLPPRVRIPVAPIEL
jgi:hypothetical protein